MLNDIPGVQKMKYCNKFVYYKNSVVGRNPHKLEKLRNKFPPL